MRRATADDTEALAAFNADVFRDAEGVPGAEFAHWTRDLMRGDYPTCGPDDFTLVEDMRSSRIASAMCLFS